MNKLSIYTKSKTLLVNALSKHVDLTILDEEKALTSEFDVYFHSGAINENVIRLVNNANKTIVNSNSARTDILNKVDIEKEKVNIVYPAIRAPKIKPKKLRKQFCKELDIDKKNRIIFFTARTLKSNGVKEFFDTISTLNNDNYKIIIASDETQINTLKFQIAKFKLDDKVIFYEDYKDMDLLYAVSDIFVLPTYVKNFSINILKAMSLKTAVFVSSNNSAKEVVDVFATMESPTDPNTSFKIDALLNNKNELKLIKKQNEKVAKRFYIQKQIQSLLVILNIT